MWSNDKFILASKEIKKARRRLLVSFVFVFSVFIGIFSQILSFPFQEKSKLLLANQLVNSDNTEVLEKIYVYNLNKYVKQLWKGLKRLFDPITVAKFVIVS